MNRPREGVSCILGPVRLLPLLTPLPLPSPPPPQMRTFHALLLDAARCSVDIPEAKYLKTALNGAQVRATYLREHGPSSSAVSILLSNVPPNYENKRHFKVP